MSIHKVLLEHSHAHLFKHCLWLLSCSNSRVEYFRQKPYDPQSLKYVLSGPLQKKFANPCSKRYPMSLVRPCRAVNPSKVPYRSPHHLAAPWASHLDGSQTSWIYPGAYLLIPASSGTSINPMVQARALQLFLNPLHLNFLLLHPINTSSVSCKPIPFSIYFLPPWLNSLAFPAGWLDQCPQWGSWPLLLGPLIHPPPGSQNGLPRIQIWLHHFPSSITSVVEC